MAEGFDAGRIVAAGGIFTEIVDDGAGGGEGLRMIVEAEAGEFGDTELFAEDALGVVGMEDPVFDAGFDAARAIESRFGVKVKGIVGADDASRASDVKDANIVFAAGAIGVHLLPESAWQNNPNIELLADANAQPPLGIEGIEATDKGKERHGKLCFGALGIGGLKLKLHRACIGKLFDSSERVLDAEEIYALAKEMA